MATMQDVTYSTHSFREGLPAVMLHANPGLCRAFRAILLLTGNATQAENALLCAIQSTDTEGVSDEGLLIGAVTEALARTCPVTEQTGSLDRSLSVLPPELGRVLRLMPLRRHCFVL